MATAGGPFAGKSFIDVLGDPNFQNLLAGVGARLDPQGIGGALGGATIALNKSVGAQRVAENQGEAQQAQAKLVADALNQQRLSATPPVGVPVTPPNQPGPTSIKANPDGTVTTTSTPDNTQQLITPNVTTPNPNVSQAGKNVLGAINEVSAVNNEAPITLPGVTVTAQREPEPAPVVQASSTPSTPAPAAQRFVNRGSQTPIDMQNFLPFYSRQRV